MSSTSRPFTSPIAISQYGSKMSSTPSHRPEPRRVDPEQGRALEMLGHAIEYLVDSRLYDTRETPADADAVQVLMSCSREVFAECEVVVSWHHKMQQALRKKLNKKMDA